jgi:hypothetical protein
MNRRPPLTSALSLLASREHHNRYGQEQLARCLFLDPREDRLIGAYHQGDLLDEQKAQRLWDAHQWAIHAQQSIAAAV